MKVTEVLVAVNIGDKRRSRPVVPRNGIVLCQTHYTIFDKHFFNLNIKSNFDNMRIIVAFQRA